MEPGDKCRQGEKYRFKADHTVAISQCVNSQMQMQMQMQTQTQTQTWSIESADALETHIKVGDKSYIRAGSSSGHDTRDCTAASGSEWGSRFLLQTLADRSTNNGADSGQNPVVFLDELLQLQALI